MIYIALSVICSSMLIVILRLFEAEKINNLPAIIVNYFVCAFIGFFFVEDIQTQFNTIATEAVVIAIGLGTLFIILFNIIALSAQKVGVSITATAQKLSFIFPVLFGVIFLSEHFPVVKWLGVVLAIAAVIVITKDKSNPHLKGFVWIPVIVFIGSGVCDVVIKVVQENYLQSSQFPIFNAVLFSTACLGGLVTAIIKRTHFTRRDILGGIVLGIPNYGSLYFLLISLEKSGFSAAGIFTANNLLIVAFTSILGVIIFRESFKKYKIIGLLLALMSILIIGFYS